MLEKIVSGGQTGADRAALDFAIEHGIPHGGWCPKDRLAEDGRIGDHYTLKETPSGGYVQRTDWNVRDSDGTVILTIADRLQGGSGETARFALKHGKPCLHLAAQRAGVDHATVLRCFVQQQRLKVLNVAGPRGSEEPTVAEYVTNTLRAALTVESAAERTFCALVLDDDTMLWDMLKAILPEYRVFGAETGEQALQLAKQHKFDFVVTDAAHPGRVDGFQFIAAMKKAHPSVPVIMASGGEARTLKPNALGLGACAYISKPFVTATFLAAVDAALSHRGGGRGLQSMPQPPTLETERLVLRPLAPEDAASVARLAGCRKVADMTITIPHPYSESQAREWIAARTSQARTGKEIVFAVATKEDVQLIGAVGLREIDAEHSQAEMGFWIGVPSWGKGFATEAARRLVRYAFEDLKLNRVYAHHMVRNPASGRVLEKVGMKREGLLRQRVRKRGVFEDVLLLAVLLDDWKQTIGKTA